LDELMNSKFGIEKVKSGIYYMMSFWYVS
jgi:hypothetical protein